MLVSLITYPKVLKGIILRTIYRFRLSGGADVFTHPAKKNDPVEFDGMIYRECL